jgi:hypothetical protein
MATRCLQDGASLPVDLATPVHVVKLSPELPVYGMNISLGEFWSWAYSNLLSNLVRGVFAEYIVAHTLGITDRPRIDWNAFDLSYRGKRIEVKASAYLQSWPQKTRSRIGFDIRPKISWDAETGKSLLTAARSADCFVFCLYQETELSGRTPMAVLDMQRWCFYVASVLELEEKFGNHRHASLKGLAPFGPFASSELRSRIEEKLGLTNSSVDESPKGSR